MGLEQQIREMIILHPEQPFALLLINLDGFKRINDGQGFDVGNELLLMAANRLRNCIKGSDWLGRTSGDEFALLLPNVEGQEVPSKVAHRIVETLGLAYELGDTPAFVGSSVGIALYPEDGRELLTLLRNAELALDRVKRSGGRDYQFFHPSMAAAAENRRRLENELRLAAERQELRLFYQPIVDIQQNRLAGAEALIRWVHPQQGMVPPDEFIPVAEETGLIQEIGLWVLETACDQLQQWRQEGREELYLSINVSGSQIPHGLPPAAVVEALSRRSLPPSALVLEITEGVLMSDMRQALDWLQALRQVGIRIYLDDFGTGYSSLSYLKRFPLHTLKLDRSFIRDIAEDPVSSNIVASIIELGQHLNMDILAEGVETDQQRGILLKNGCRTCQGFLFSRPLPAAELEARWLQATAGPGAPPRN
jgi:diguanylate cyclase (GGDEF)-like protein